MLFSFPLAVFRVACGRVCAHCVAVAAAAAVVVDVDVDVEVEALEPQPTRNMAIRNTGTKLVGILLAIHSMRRINIRYFFLSLFVYATGAPHRNTNTPRGSSGDIFCEKCNRVGIKPLLSFVAKAGENVRNL
jgi:hypothetical protein